MYILVFLALIFAVFAKTEIQEVKNVPKYDGTLKSKMYSGYIEVEESHHRHLFFMFAESQSNPSNDPVILWLNGGPGCSSMEGMMNELGPFLLNEKGDKVLDNEYSWNKGANVIFVESPAGVGFSYSEFEEDYRTCNDNRTATDLYSFLEVFFTNFPEYQKNRFFVAGESYAGHYVPVVTQTIFKENLKSPKIKINLEGYLVGNGCSDDANDINSMPIWMQQHSLISQKQYERAVEACGGDFYHNQEERACASALDSLFNNIEGVNMYGIYNDCYGFVDNTDGIKYTSPISVRKQRHKLFHNPFQLDNTNGGVPCMNTDNLYNYLNDKEVMAAFGAKLPAGKFWEECNMEINMYYDKTFDSIIPIHKYLINNGVRAMIYSGDTDFAVNALGTEMSIDAIIPEKAQEWERFFTYNPSKQVAGYFKEARGMTFCTIRGAGHMVPSDKPQISLEILTKFLNHESLN